MRTTIELIDDLQREAEGALGCFLVVGFENTTLFVASNEPDALGKLNGMVEMGGHPVGMLRMLRGRPHELRIEVRSLDECKNDSEVESYLERLAEQFIQNAADASGMTPIN
jgi:hypothetical protein